MTKSKAIFGLFAISDGDVVVTDGHLLLTDGTRVSVRERAAGA